MALNLGTKKQVTAKPKRIQMSEKRDYNMIADSRNINGLPVVNCAKPSRYGNPFEVGDKFPNRKGKVKTKKEMLELFRVYAAGRAKLDPKWIDYLKGHNLACFCKVGDPCHADFLLELVSGK